MSVNQRNAFEELFPRRQIETTSRSQQFNIINSRSHTPSTSIGKRRRADTNDSTTPSAINFAGQSSVFGVSQASNRDILTLMQANNSLIKRLNEQATQRWDVLTERIASIERTLTNVSNSLHGLADGLTDQQKGFARFDIRWRLKRPIAFKVRDYAASLLLDSFKQKTNFGTFSGNDAKAVADIRKIVTEEKSTMKGRLIECSRSFQDASLQRFGEVLLQVKDGSRLSFEEQQVSGLWRACVRIVQPYRYKGKNTEFWGDVENAMKEILERGTIEVLRVFDIDQFGLDTDNKNAKSSGSADTEMERSSEWIEEMEVRSDWINEETTTLPKSTWPEVLEIPDDNDTEDIEDEDEDIYIGNDEDGKDDEVAAHQSEVEDDEHEEIGLRNRGGVDEPKRSTQVNQSRETGEQIARGKAVETKEPKARRSARVRRKRG